MRLRCWIGLTLAMLHLQTHYEKRQPVSNHITAGIRALKLNIQFLHQPHPMSAMNQQHLLSLQILLTFLLLSIAFIDSAIIDR